MSRLLFTLIVLFSVCGEALESRGSIDLYYQFNFNQPQVVTPPSSTSLSQPAGNNTYRIFDLYHDTLSLSLVELSLSHKMNRSEVVLDLAAGQTVEILSPRDEVSKHLLQAYINIAPEFDHRLTIQVGKMYTHLGFEVVKASENWNYSRSVLFGYAIPFWHVGAAVRYALVPEKLNLGLFIYNENTGLYETNRSKSVGLQLQGSLWGDSQVTYNFLSGPEISSDGVTHVRTLHEGIWTQPLSDNWQMAVDVVFGQLSRARSNQRRNAQWIAWAAYLKWQHDKFYLSPRYEIYTDRSGATVETATTEKPALPQRLITSTLTAGWEFEEGIEWKFEGRHDRSSARLFNAHDQETRPTQTTLSTALVVKF